MKKMFTVTLAVTISSPLWSMPNLIANGTFEATDGTKYTNGSWAYSNEDGGRPTVWSYPEGGCGLMNQGEKAYNGLATKEVGTHSFFFERSTSDARELSQTFTIPAPGIYRYFWNYTNWSKKYGGAEVVAELAIGGESGKLAAFTPPGKTNPGLLSVSGATNLTQAGVECTLKFSMAANATTSGSATYYYNVIDNVSLCLDTLIVADGESFTYVAGLNPEAITLGANAALTVLAADAAEGVPGNVTLGEGAKITFDMTGFTGDAVFFRTGGFVLPVGAGDVLSFIELMGTGAENFTKRLGADGRSILIIGPTAPFSATWNGAGNWTCRTLTGTDLSEGTVPSEATFFVSLGAAADWTSGLPTALPNATIDLSGFGLSVPGLDAESFAVAAITNSGEKADLRVVVASDTSENTSVSIGGAIRLVKAGAGTLIDSKAGQTYCGGTKVEAGILVAGVDGAAAPFGDVTNLVRNGTFGESGPRTGLHWDYTKDIPERIPEWIATDNTGLFPAHVWWGSSYSELRYGLFFEGTSSASQTLSVSAPGRYRIRFGYGPWTGHGNNSKYDPTTLTLILSNGDNEVYKTQVTPAKGEKAYAWVEETFVVEEPGDYTLGLSTAGSGYVYCIIDNLEIARWTEIEVCDGASLDINSKTGFDNLRVTLAGGTVANTGGSGATELNVGGVFRPETAIPFTPVLQDGTTLDLSQWTGAWPLEGVKFASGASMTVFLGSSASVRELAGTKGYLLGWDESPDATFTLHESSQNYLIQTDVTGLKVSLRKGLVILLY